MRLHRFVPLFFVAFQLSAATITVTGSGDSIAVDGACTLREAITAANTNAPSGDCNAGSPGLDRIEFAIGSGPQQVVVITAYPDIVDPVTIDGTTQSGFAGVPLIEISKGGGIDSFPAFRVVTTGGGSTVRGLVINHFDSGAGIELRSSGNVIAGNYIGTDPTGTLGLSNGNAIGVSLFGAVGAPSSNNTMGGVTVADRNVISGNHVAIAVTVAPAGTADANVILGNFVGWNAAGTAIIGNLLNGVHLGGATNTTISGNSIAGTSGPAIQLDGGASDTLIQTNVIGGPGAGNSGSGVEIQSGNDNIIGSSMSGGPGGNDIRFNSLFVPDATGVRLAGGTGNRVSGNMMANNGLSGAGIDIGDAGHVGPTANDACDSDTGANLLQNKPVLTSAIHSGGMVTVSGSLNSTASASYTIDLYANPPNTLDQGFMYLGSTGVTTGAGCDGSFTSTIAFTPPLDGYTVSATAIDGAGNTSEMSTPVFMMLPLAGLDVPLSRPVLMVLVIFLSAIGAFLLRRA